MDASTYLRQSGWERDPFRAAGEFWNRQEELSALRYVLSVSQSARVVVHGSPGVGVTRLLQQVAATMDGTAFYLPLPVEPEQFPWQLWLTVSGHAEAPLQPSDWGLSETQLWAQLLRRTANLGGPVHLFLDGLAELAAGDQETFLRRYRDPLAACGCNIVLGCGPEALARLKESPFAAIVTDYLPVVPFSVDECRAFLDHRLTPAVEQGHFDQEAVNLIAEASGGNLKLLHEIGKQCLLIGYRREADPISREIAEEAVRRALSDRLEALSEDQRTLLAYLVEHGAVSPSDAELQELLPVSRGRISQLLNDLLQAGFVQRRQAGRRYLYRPTLWAQFV
jgi:hypothetical protein